MNNEQELIRRAQRGDGEAFRQLVEAYQTQVYRLALRMCGESAADDVTQEAFLAAWRALPDFRGDCRFSTWLYRLTTNAGIDWLRREKRYRSADDVTELELPDDAPSLQEQAEQSETQSAVRWALSRLSEEVGGGRCVGAVDLEQEPACGAQGVLGQFHQGAIEEQWVVVGHEECALGFVV